jgi:ABC-type transport system substrate-binding protein
MESVNNKCLKNMINIFVLFFLFFINSNCGNKIRNNGYKKVKGNNYVKIDYTKYIEKHSENEINLSFTDFPHTLNPYRAAIESEFFFNKALFSSLFYFDLKTGLPEKNLVDKINIINNGLEYYFTLKHDIKFNDGSILSSEDVVSSLNLLNTVLKDTEIYKKFFLLNNELVIESVSYDKFKISLDVPNGNLLYALANFPIIPKEIAEIISENIETFINYWEIKKNINLIGSGPFKVDEIGEDSIILSRNKYYFKKDQNGNNLPYTKKINVRFFNNKNNEILGFINNDTDIISITEDDYNILNEYFMQNKISKIRFVNTGFSKNRVVVAYNCFKENSKSYLKDNNFREYLSYFIKSAVNGDNENLKKYSVNKDFFKDLNHDSILEYKDGNTIYIRIIANEEEKKIVDLVKGIKTIFEDLNFEVYLEIVPLHVFLEKMFIDFDYDLGIFYYNFDPGIISYYQLLNKDGLSFYPFVNSNLSSGKIIQKLEDCINTVSNKTQVEKIKELKDLLEDMNQLFTIYSQDEFYLARSNMYNFKINSSLEEGYNLQTIETIIKSSIM